MRWQGQVPCLMHTGTLLVESAQSLWSLFCVSRAPIDSCSGPSAERKRSTLTGFMLPQEKKTREKPHRRPPNRHSHTSTRTPRGWKHLASKTKTKKIHRRTASDAYQQIVFVLTATSTSRAPHLAKDSPKFSQWDWRKGVERDTGRQADNTGGGWRDRWMN